MSSSNVQSSLSSELGGRLPHSPATNHKIGYADVARWMALDIDSEGHVYRKFDELAARNLLYYQSELFNLMAQLDDLDKKDADSDNMDLRDAARTWETLESRLASNDDEAKSRMDLILSVREKIREYHEALLLHSEITKLRRPSRRVLNAFRIWFKGPVPALGGRAKTFLDHPDDLIALKTAPEPDYMSQFLLRYWPAKKELSRDGSSSIKRYEEESIALAAVVINVIVAAVLLTGSIISLYFVHNDIARLAMTAAFTTVFSISISVVTTARRAEIYGATAAYAAVLVVFVSSNLSSSPTS